MIHAFFFQKFFSLKCETCFDYDSMTSIKKNILTHETREAIKKNHVRFLRNAIKKIRFECCQKYKKCCRDLAQLKDLKILFEKTLLTYDILINFSLFCFSILSTISKNLIQLFASVSHNILCSLIWIRNEITIFAKFLNFLRKIKSIYFNLFNSVIQIRSKLCQNLKHRLI